MIQTSNKNKTRDFQESTLAMSTRAIYSYTGPPAHRLKNGAKKVQASAERTLLLDGECRDGSRRVKLPRTLLNTHMNIRNFAGSWESDLEEGCILAGS
jgi:hypothetical protein